MHVCMHACMGDTQQHGCQYMYTKSLEVPIQSSCAQATAAGSYWSSRNGDRQAVALQDDSSCHIIHLPLIFFIYFTFILHSIYIFFILIFAVFYICHI